MLLLPIKGRGAGILGVNSLACDGIMDTRAPSQVNQSKTINATAPVNRAMVYCNFIQGTNFEATWYVESFIR